MYRFQVKAETIMGESIAIIGSTPELGMWQVEDCIHLNTSEQDYPLWWIELDLLAVDGENKIEYKYIRLLDDGNVEWESLSDTNRWIPDESEARSQTIIVDDGDFGHIQPLKRFYGVEILFLTTET